MDANATYALVMSGDADAARDLLEWLNRGGFLPAGANDHDVRSNCAYVIHANRRD